MQTLRVRQLRLEKEQLGFEDARQKQLQLRQYEGARQHFLQDFKRFQNEVGKLPAFSKKVARARAAATQYERDFFVDSAILLASRWKRGALARFVALPRIRIPPTATRIRSAPSPS